MKFLTATRWFKKRTPPEKPFRVILPDNKIDPMLDRNSDTWRFVESWAVQELRALRERNDKLSLDAEATAAIRGEIKRLKKLLSLQNERPDTTDARSKSFAADIFGTDGDY